MACIGYEQLGLGALADCLRNKCLYNDKVLRLVVVLGKSSRDDFFFDDFAVR